VDNLAQGQDVGVVEQLHDLDLPQCSQRKLTMMVIDEPHHHISMLTPSCSRFSSTFLMATASFFSLSMHL
jgi:hypothetical protein